MTPSKSDYIAVLAAVQDGQPLSVHQVSIIVAALQRAAEMPAATPAKLVAGATPPNPEIFLVPAVLAKAEEACSMLREIRDLMRRRDDPAARQARSRLVAMVGSRQEETSS